MRLSHTATGSAVNPLFSSSRSDSWTDMGFDRGRLPPEPGVRIGRGPARRTRAYAGCAPEPTPTYPVGALTVVATPEEDRTKVFRGLLGWGVAMIVIGPLLSMLFAVL